jgi:hypothetical protein
VGRPLGAVDIQRVGQNYASESLGMLFLNGPVDQAHVPAEQLVRLSFRFRHTSVFWRSTGDIIYPVLFKPRAGALYEFEVSYAGELFDVRIKDGSGRAVAPIDPALCR